MKLIIDIPKYDLDKVKIGSIASRVIFKAVKNGIPYDEKPQGERAERALTIIDRLRTEGHINNREQGVLRRAILLPERAKGEWIEKTDKDYCGGGYWMCSECKMRYSFGAYHEVDEFDFCPKCGNPMKAVKARDEYDEEARREAMRLDDNEDTYKWRGHA